MNKLISILMIVVFIASIIIIRPVSSVFGVQKDTSWFDYENPKKSYKITTEAQLMGLSSLVNENQEEKWKPTRLENFEGVRFTLTKDITLTQKWNPIGTGTASHFSGVFDGNGHTISGLDIDSETGNAGFFGYFTGEVRNLKLEGKVNSKAANCGAFVGQLNSSARVINCTSDVKVTGTSKTGGLVGYNESGVIKDCTNSGNVSGTFKVGGIVGENWGGSITQSDNSGTITSSERGVSTYGTGGIAGRSVSAKGYIAECYNTGEIVSYTEGTGGIVGYTNAIGTTVENCYNNAGIRIAGDSTKNVQDDEKELTPAWAGGVIGIVGADGVIVSNCYNSGKIKNADYAGGVIGLYIDTPNKKVAKRIENNYYAGELFKRGVGQSEADEYKTDVPSSVNSAQLDGMATTLGTAFMNDTSGVYGNEGNPVLRWQKPVAKDQRSYLPDISKKTQMNIDDYLVETADDTPQGQAVLDTFNPKNFMTDALTQYNEAKKKHKAIDEEAK